MQKLAIGGMAQLFLAQRVRPAGKERQVVLKRILPHLAEDTAFITMFLDEAKIAARLHHPNVVEILDLGAEGESYFIAMEYIHGEDMRRIGRRATELGRKLPPEVACRVVAQAALGLDYAHKRADQSGRPLQIVHRDVSPQNLLVSFTGEVKVVDFGIAKAIDKATVTASGVIKGKHAYMSPEQALGRPIDHRTDVFALGIVLYEFLTGARLFRRATDLQTLKSVSECRVDPPARTFPHVPRELDAIVMRALAKDLDARYQDAASLAADLEDWLGTRGSAGTQQALGAWVSELFADRLQREAAEGRIVPTRSNSMIDRAATPQKNIGTASMRPLLPRAGPGSELRTIQLGPNLQGPPPPSGRMVTASSATPVVPVKAIKLPITEPVRVANVATTVPQGLAAEPRTDPNATQRVSAELAAAHEPRTDPHADHRAALASLKLDEPERGGTVPYGRSLTAAAVVSPRPAEGLEIITAPVGDLADDAAPTGLHVARSGPSRLMIGGVAVLAVSALAAVGLAVTVGLQRSSRGGLQASGPVTREAPGPVVDRLDGSSPPAVPVEVSASPTSPADAGPAQPPVVYPREVPPGSLYPVTVKEGRLFAEVGAVGALPLGAALHLYGAQLDGSPERDFVGEASVVELDGLAARLLFDGAEGLPAALWAAAMPVPVPDEPAEVVDAGLPRAAAPRPTRGGATLVGSVQRRAGAAHDVVVVKNATDFGWSRCDVRLPDNTWTRLRAEQQVPARGSLSLEGGQFRLRAGAPDPRFAEGFAHLTCAEGDGYLKLALVP